MTKELFSKKIIALRKKHHLTQQELADKLNISNKTVSRWETAESYPDIELLPEIAEIFHVSIDYLLTDRENIHDLEKTDIVRYIPFIIGLAAMILYYLLQKIGMPVIFCFLIYILMIRFSYRFYQQYTDHKNGEMLVNLTTLTGFFSVQSIVSQLILFLVVANQIGLGFIFIANGSISLDGYSEELASGVISSYMISYIAAGIYAYFHYQKYIKKTEI